MAEEQIPSVGELRWPVVLARRDQLPDADVGITEVIANGIQMWAKIEGTRPVTYYGAQQVDLLVSHMIWIRWVDWIDTSYVVVRNMRRPDGTIRRELFRIRRIIEVNGRQRFIRIEADQELRE